MTQEDKELLLKDLCARLPYKVKINVNGEEDTLLELGVDTDWVNASYDINDVKPYLRPVLSMIEDEKVELYHYYCNEIADNLNTPNLTWEVRCSVSDFFGTDWLNAHHFDYHGLIEKGLALEAPEGMY